MSEFNRIGLLVNASTKMQPSWLYSGLDSEEGCYIDTLSLAILITQGVHSYQCFGNGDIELKFLLGILYKFAQVRSHRHSHRE